jgi:glycosyltransferase involved in cell wall biosynthesis
VPADRSSEHYFRTEIEPHLDGAQIAYVGPVDDEHKSKWLTQAAALLMPIQWDEPFGIVMAEALASGTPVIGLGRGAVCEVVDDALTGFVCKDVDQMVRAVARLPELSRSRCRQVAEDRFSQTALVEAYESLYRQLVSVPISAAGRAPQGAGA